MSPQVLPEDSLDLGRGAVDWEGVRVGELTGIRVVEKCPSRGNVWLMRCDCGRYALRGSGQLNQAIKRGSEPACSECLAELRGGHFASKREQSEARKAEYYRRALSGEPLWTYEETRNLVERIREDCAGTFGFMPEPAPSARFDARMGYALPYEAEDFPYSPHVKPVSGADNPCTVCGSGYAPFCSAECRHESYRRKIRYAQAREEWGL